MSQPLEPLIAWLEAGAHADYRAGVLLLQAHTGYRSLVNNLLKKESLSNREKLRYELVKVGCGCRLQDVNEVLNHFAQAVQGATEPLGLSVTQGIEIALGPEQPAPDVVPYPCRARWTTSPSSCSASTTSGAS